MSKLNIKNCDMKNNVWYKKKRYVFQNLIEKYYLSDEIPTSEVLSDMFLSLTLSTLKSDQHPISPHSSASESFVKFVGIKKMIAYV